VCDSTCIVFHTSGVAPGGTEGQRSGASVKHYARTITTTAPQLFYPPPLRPLQASLYTAPTLRYWGLVGRRGGGSPKKRTNLVPFSCSSRAIHIFFEDQIPWIWFYTTRHAYVIGCWCFDPSNISVVCYDWRHVTVVGTRYVWPYTSLVGAYYYAILSKYSHSANRKLNNSLLHSLPDYIMKINFVGRRRQQFHLSARSLGLPHHKHFEGILRWFYFGSFDCNKETTWSYLFSMKFRWQHFWSILPSSSPKGTHFWFFTFYWALLAGDSSVACMYLRPNSPVLI
jgi:hypothetical protein